MKFRVKGEYILLTTIIILSFVVKLFIIGEMSFSNDEFSAIFRLEADSLKELVENGIWVDGHPGGVQVFLYYWTKLFPINEFNLRLPFAFFSSLGLLFAYKFTKRISGSLAAILTVITIGFLEFYLKYSIIARPYASGMFLAFFNAWFLIKVTDIKKNDKFYPKILNTILLGLAFSLQAYNHYFSGLLAILMAITVLFMLKKENITYVFSSFIIAIILFIPHIPISMNHISIGGVGEWLGKPDAIWIIDFLYLLMNKSLVVIVSLVSLLTFIYLKKSSLVKINKWQVAILLWFLLSFFISYVYSIKVNPVLIDRSLIFSSVFIIVFAFSFSKLQISDKYLPLVFIYFSIIVISTFKFNSFINKNHFANFKAIPQTIYKLKQNPAYKSAEIICHTNSLKYIKYYENDNQSIDYSINYLKSNDDLKRLKKILTSSKKDNIIFAEISNSHPQAFDMIIAEYPYILENESYGKLSSIYLFSKKGKNNIKPKPIAFFKEKALNIDSNKTYSNGLNYKVLKNDINKDIKVFSRSEYNPQNAEFQLVFQVINKDKNKNHFTSSNSKYFNNNIVLDYKYKIKKGDKEIKIYIWNNNSEKIEFTDVFFGVFNDKKDFRY